MKFRTAILAMATLAVCTTGYATAITNGGFETGTFSGWALTGNVDPGWMTGVCANGSFFGGVVTCSSNSGNYAAVLGPNGPGASMQQSVATTDGGEYDLTFYLLNDNQNQTPDNSIDVFFGGKNVYSRANLDAFGYQKITIRDLATYSDVSMLDFTVRNVPGGFFIDDVSLNAVPEPACLLLVTAALGMFGLMRRKKLQ